MNYPKSLQNLMDSFNKLPGIGKKTAERLALYVYSSLDENSAKIFSESLIDVKTSLGHCEICGNLSENKTCDICSDDSRNKKTVMVVENVKDLFVLEKLKQYDGVYHVLNGAINFSSGIGIEDINLAPLIEKINNKEFKEVILATNATLEGETTARYINALLESNDDIIVSRIAHGIPVGGDISYADEMTILKALENRRKY